MSAGRLRDGRGQRQGAALELNGRGEGEDGLGSGSWESGSCTRRGVCTEHGRERMESEHGTRETLWGERLKRRERAGSVRDGKGDAARMTAWARRNVD